MIVNGCPECAKTTGGCVDHSVTRTVYGVGNTANPYECKDCAALAWRVLTLENKLAALELRIQAPLMGHWSTPQTAGT